MQSLNRSIQEENDPNEGNCLLCWLLTRKRVDKGRIIWYFDLFVYFYLLLRRGSHFSKAKKGIYLWHNWSWNYQIESLLKIYFFLSSKESYLAAFYMNFKMNWKTKKSKANNKQNNNNKNIIKKKCYFLDFDKLNEILPKLRYLFQYFFCCFYTSFLFYSSSLHQTLSLSF